MLTIEGIFDGQKIEAVGKIPFIDKKRVLITFLEDIPYLPISERKTPAQVLSDLFGTWEDDRDAEEIIAEIRNARKNSTKFISVGCDLAGKLFGILGKDTWEEYDSDIEWRRFDR